MLTGQQIADEIARLHTAAGLPAHTHAEADVTSLLADLALRVVDPTTTKGDLITRNSSDPTRLGVGANAFVLTADSTQATGLKWAALPVASFASLEKYRVD